MSCEKAIIQGAPDCDLISTSYIERLNATTRLHMRRLTRLTLAFSKKRENFEAAVALHFAYYNFAKNSQLGPFMADLKIEVDGTVKDAAISAPGLPGRLRVVVSTQNGATIIDIPRPNKKG